MKRLSIPLLMTLFLAPVAFAPVQIKQEVLIYSFTEKSAEYTCDVNGVIDMTQINNLPWKKSTVTKTGFVVMQQTAPLSMEVWFFNTWKAPDPNGKMKKYAKPEQPVDYSLAQAHIGEKETWLVSLDSSGGHIFLTGVEKHVFIKAADKFANVPTVLTGSNNWYYQSYDKIMHAGSSTLTLRLHSKFTNAYYADPALLNAQYAVEAVVGAYLIDKGYEIIPIIIN